jgi:DNA-binding response OmpR family regulator
MYCQINVSGSGGLRTDTIAHEPLRNIAAWLYQEFTHLMAYRVLVVDDDPAIRLVTKRLLKLLKCEPYEAKDGAEGLAMALETNPEVILLDIMMPIQDGYETCLKLRAQGYTGTILLFSSLLRETERAHALRIGANDYIQKPVTREQLAAFLNVDQQSATATA